MSQVLTITQINEYLKNKMDDDGLLSQVAVAGEVSNYKLYPSGHHYFTLKDENAALKCVMFKGNAFRLRFRPENGMKVIALGKISVYPRDGAFQLYCTAMMVDGVGDLHAAFEQLKAKLAAQGLFDPGHKKPIPAYPQTIGIVTSPAGAAVHDMLRILRARYPLVKVRLIPVRVQGAEAPGEIAAAIRYANAHNLADLLIVGRGGGSIEDLWAFNEEVVAHAIYDSQIPIISAVGHEPDVTISDFVADLRAATPSNAAELAVPDMQALYQNLDAMQASMLSSLSRQLKLSRQRLSMLANSKVLQSPEAYLSVRQQSLALLRNRLIAAQSQNIGFNRQRFVGLVSKLDAMSPMKVLLRGYAITADKEGNLLRSIRQVQPGNEIQVNLSDGTLTARVETVQEADNGEKNEL